MFSRNSDVCPFGQILRNGMSQEHFSTYCIFQWFSIVMFFFFKLLYLETFLILLYGSCTNRNVILDIKFKPFLFSLTLHLLYKYLVNKRKQYQNNSNGKMKSYFNDFIIRFFCNIKHWQYSQQFLNDLLVMRETK